MLETDLNARPKLHPVVNIVIIFLVTAGGFIVIGPIIGYFVALLFYPGDWMEMINALQDFANHPEVKVPFYVIQASATGIGLILVPYMYLRQRGTSVREFLGNERTEWIPVVVSVLVLLAFIPVTSLFAEWNAEYKLPESAPENLKSLESWAREKEDQGELMTAFLTNFESVWDLMLVLVVVAILPAIGEEFVFRGLIQTELMRATGNGHAAIWIAAFIFSFFHVQFYGFVPRLMLGALFGYLYYWSGNLTLAMIAHFANNGVQVIALYFYQQGALDLDMESTEALPAPVISVGAVLTAVLLYYFYKYFENRKSRFARL